MEFSVEDPYGTARGNISSFGSVYDAYVAFHPFRSLSFLDKLQLDVQLVPGTPRARTQPESVSHTGGSYFESLTPADKRTPRPVFYEYGRVNRPGRSLLFEGYKFPCV